MIKDDKDIIKFQYTRIPRHHTVLVHIPTNRKEKETTEGKEGKAMKHGN